MDFYPKPHVIDPAALSSTDYWLLSSSQTSLSLLKSVPQKHLYSTNISVWYLLTTSTQRHLPRDTYREKSK